MGALFTKLTPEQKIQRKWAKGAKQLLEKSDTSVRAQTYAKYKVRVDTAGTNEIKAFWSERLASVAPFQIGRLLELRELIKDCLDATPSDMVDRSMISKLKARLVSLEYDIDPTGTNPHLKSASSSSSLPIIQVAEAAEVSSAPKMY